MLLYFLFDDYCLVIKFCVSLGFIVLFMFFSPTFDFGFLSTKEIGWEQCLWYDLFSVTWDVIP